MRFMSNPSRSRGVPLSQDVCKNSPKSSNSAVSCETLCVIMDFGFPVIYVPNCAARDTGDYIKSTFDPRVNGVVLQKELLPMAYGTHAAAHVPANQHYSLGEVRGEGASYYTSNTLSFGGIP